MENKYPVYKEDLRSSSRGNRIVSGAIDRLFLSKTSEQITKGV